MAKVLKVITPLERSLQGSLPLCLVLQGLKFVPCRGDTAASISAYHRLDFAHQCAARGAIMEGREEQRDQNMRERRHC